MATIYTISSQKINVPMLHAEYTDQVKSEKQAIAIAKRWAKEHDGNFVSIKFYRESDGQEGFLNENGYSLTGKGWGNYDED